MLPKHYAFVDASGLVVQVICGDLTPEQQHKFLSDYRLLFGADQIIELESDAAVWIGGAYTDGVFAPPPAPEPAPEIVEGVSEVLPEPQPETEI